MAQHTVIAVYVTVDSATTEGKTGSKRRANGIIGVARDGGVMELNARAVPYVDPIHAVTLYAGAYVLKGLDEAVVIGGNPMTAVTRDGDVVEGEGTII